LTYDIFAYELNKSSPLIIEYKHSAVMVSDLN